MVTKGTGQWKVRLFWVFFHALSLLKVFADKSDGYLFIMEK